MAITTYYIAFWNNHYNVKDGLLYSRYSKESEELIFIKTKNKKDLVQELYFDLESLSAQVQIDENAEMKEFISRGNNNDTDLPRFTTKNYFILSDTIEKIKDWEEWEDPDFCWDMLNKDPGCIAFIKHPTEEMALTAVNKNGLLLQFIKEEHQTNRIGYEAVKQNNQACDYLSSKHPWYSKEKTIYQPCLVCKTIWPESRTPKYDSYGKEKPC